MVLSFLDGSGDSYRSQHFILNKLSSIRANPNQNPETVMVDYLPKIQDILKDMKNLEELKSRGEQQQYRIFKSNLISKVNIYLQELNQQKSTWSCNSNNMDSSLLEEYKQQLKGILDVLSQPETHSEISYSQNGNQGTEQGKVIEQTRTNNSQVITEKTFSSNNMSQMMQSEKRNFHVEEQNKDHRQTGKFVYEQNPNFENSKTMNRSTLDQKLNCTGEVARKQRFTFKNISSDKREYVMKSKDFYETIDRAREQNKINNYCKKFNDVQVQLVQEKIKRKNDLWETEKEKQKWKQQLMKGGLIFCFNIREL
jgi:hypothetical protein